MIDSSVFSLKNHTVIKGLENLKCLLFCNRMLGKTPRQDIHCEFPAVDKQLKMRVEMLWQRYSKIVEGEKLWNIRHDLSRDNVK